jgi:hypothetical protein
MALNGPRIHENNLGRAHRLGRLLANSAPAFAAAQIPVDVRRLFNVMGTRNALGG